MIILVVLVKASYIKNKMMT